MFTPEVQQLEKLSKRRYLVVSIRRTLEYTAIGEFQEAYLQRVDTVLHFGIPLNLDTPNSCHLRLYVKNFSGRWVLCNFGLQPFDFQQGVIEMLKLARQRITESISRRYFAAHKSYYRFEGGFGPDDENPKLIYNVRK